MSLKKTTDQFGVAESENQKNSPLPKTSLRELLEYKAQSKVLVNHLKALSGSSCTSTSPNINTLSNNPKNKNSQTANGAVNVFPTSLTSTK